MADKPNPAQRIKSTTTTTTTDYLDEPAGYESDRIGNKTARASKADPFQRLKSTTTYFKTATAIAAAAVSTRHRPSATISPTTSWPESWEIDVLPASAVAALWRYSASYARGYQMKDWNGG